MGYNDWKTAITAWANEKVDFTYGQSAPPGKVIGHYTQVNRCLKIDSNEMKIDRRLSDGQKYRSFSWLRFGDMSKRNKCESSERLGTFRLQ